MSDIPSDVLRHMLLRLPAESLFRFRTVCKEWRCIIDDPSFVRSHTDNQESSSTLLIRTPAGSRIYYLNLDSLNYSDGLQEVTRVKTLVYPDVPRLPHFPVASCHGLVLISFGRKTWAIWNPLTGQFYDLPRPELNGFLVGTGLGYDSAADDYKAVRIDEFRTHGRKAVFQTLVYSRESDSWKMIKDCPDNFPAGSDAGVFLDGALHWRSWEVIVSLDLSTEEFYELPLPPEPSSHLSATGGSLVMSCSQSIWIFDRVDKLWTNLFSYQDLHMGGNLRPIAYLKSKGQVFLQGQGSRMIYWLDIETNTAKKFTIDELQYQFTCQIFPGSLVRLPRSCDGSRKFVKKSGGRKRKRSQRKSDRRLKWSVRVSDSRSRLDSEYGFDIGWGSESG